MKKNTDKNCVCGSEKMYRDCCERFHSGQCAAETAEQLMRSRYSAYVHKKENYLRQSWVQEQCPQEIELDNAVKWIRLEILTTEKGRQADSAGKVEFKAWFVQQDKLLCIHELSDFQRNAGHWQYHSGQLFDEPVIALTMKQDCPCGSGKKYKHCCHNG